MTRRPSRDPKTFVNIYLDQATKTMTAFGEPLMVNGAYVPGYENYLKRTLTDISGVYQRLRAERDRVEEMDKDPARSEQARRRHFEIVDILYAAEEIIWDRLSQLGVKRA